MMLLWLFKLIILNLIFINSINIIKNIRSDNKAQINEKISLDKNSKFSEIKKDDKKNHGVIIQNNIDYIPKISVIIYAYNSKENIEKSLETIINQTLKEIEIICIDDSTDDFLSILKNYAKKDPRITIIKNENKNLGIALNIGLTIVKGKYISILNSNYYFELNMLEDMYKKIEEENSDIIICKCESIVLEVECLDKNYFANNIIQDLLPKKDTFSVENISKNIFQAIGGWTCDKLFKTDFIISNNIKFPNTKNFYETQFTFTSLCLAKSITTIEKKFAIKRLKKLKKRSYLQKSQEFSILILEIDKILFILKTKKLYNLVKESFWKWAIKLCLLQLKLSEQDSKEELFNILHEKFNSWEYIDKYSYSSNIYKAFHYIKYQKDFPTINVAYSINKKNLDNCLVSIISLLKNSEFENINIILLYNDANQVDLEKVNKLKEIRSFILYILQVSNSQLKNFPFSSLRKEETWYRYLLADEFPNFERILYLDCNTIVRNSLLSLWELNMNNKLIAGVEDIFFSKDKAKILSLKDNLFFNFDVLLLNTKKWREVKFYNQIVNYIKKNKILIDNDHCFLNI